MRYRVQIRSLSKASETEDLEAPEGFEDAELWRIVPLATHVIQGGVGVAIVWRKDGKSEVKKAEKPKKVTELQGSKPKQIA